MKLKWGFPSSLIFCGQDFVDVVIGFGDVSKALPIVLFRVNFGARHSVGHVGLPPVVGGLNQAPVAIVSSQQVDEIFGGKLQVIHRHKQQSALVLGVNVEGSAFPNLS